MKKHILANTLSKTLAAGLATSLMFAAQISAAAYDMENIDRGVVAVAQSNGVFLSWRWLGYEADSTQFNVYRNGTKLNSTPIADRTNYVDTSGSTGSLYTVTAIINGVEQEASAPVTPWSDIYKKIPLNRPAGGTTPDGVSYTYSPNDASVADLDGDGQYEIVLKWDPSNSKDNSQSGYTGNVYMDAYELDGTQMWRIDMGRNIRAGAHYTQFIAYDLDSDGKAEVAMRTSDATIDGRGTVIGNASADYRTSKGYVLSGPEYLTIFDGATGAALTNTNFVPARGTVSSWGDSYGNRVDRFLAGLAWLDGEKPSLIMTRGYYTRAVITAWDWRDGQLTERWVFDTNDSANSSYRGQGAHSLSIADVDFDGKHEIIFGAATIDDDGTGLYNTGLGHGDALHVSDMDPNRPGLEVFMIHETPSLYGNYGVEMHDAATGSILWGASGEGVDVGRGVAFDIDPNYPGYEAWGSRGGFHAADGTRISTSRPSQMNFGLWWDGDLLREILDDTKIDKWNPSAFGTSRLVTAYNYGAASNNTTKATPSLAGDIFGDWREEVIWRTDTNDALIIFTTATQSNHRIRTLMHDPQYRAAIAWQNVGYNQPPHPSFFIGDGMNTPAAPDINPVGGVNIPATIDLGAVVSDSQVELAWTVSNAEFASHELYRDTDADAAGRTRIATLDWATRSYTDTDTTPGTTYFYWIKIVEQDGTTVNSTPTAATIPTGSETAITIEENVTGFCGIDGVIETEHTGYMGSGYSNADNNIATGIDYAVQVPTEGYYSVSAVYANGSTSSRPATIFANNTKFTTLPLTPTDTWTNWVSSSAASVYLNAGANKLRIEASTINGLPNIDSLVVSGNAPIAGNCDGSIITAPTPTVTPTPTAPPTPVTTTGLTIEETTGFCSVDGAVESANAGFNGSGYANTTNAIDTAVEWSVYAPQAGNYSATVRFANGGGTARDGIFEINGSISTTVALADTGSWTTYQSSSQVNLALEAGHNTVRLLATNANGLANIDSITLPSTAVSAGDCSGQLDTVATPTPAIIPTTTPTPVVTPTPAVIPTPSAELTASCEYVQGNNWDSGFIAIIQVTNTGDKPISNWDVSWSYAGGSTIAGAWNATITGSNPYTATPVGWNSTIQPGQTVEFGMQGQGGDTSEIPTITGSYCQ